MDPASHPPPRQDTITGFLLAGVGDVDLRRRPNFLECTESTTDAQLEAAFRDFTVGRPDVAVVLVAQHLAERIRPLVDAWDRPVPAVLEIPCKGHPYDPARDSVLSRVRRLFGSGGGEAGGEGGHG